MCNYFYLPTKFFFVKLHINHKWSYKAHAKFKKLVYLLILFFIYLLPSSAAPITKHLAIKPPPIIPPINKPPVTKADKQFAREDF